MSGSKFIRGDIRTSGTQIVLDDTSTGKTGILKGTNSTAIDLTLPSTSGNLIAAEHGGDSTKNLQVDVSSSTPSTKTTLVAVQTANRSISLPDASTTLVGTDTTQTLTNKSVDSDANTISNIKVTDFKASALASDLGTSATSSQLPTAASAKAYADTVAAASAAASVPTSRQVTAGAGLSGGGSLSSDITLDVSVDGSTIEIATDALRVKDLGITNAKLAGSIDAAKIGTGQVSTSVFEHLIGVSSPIQTQLNNKITANAAITAGTATKITYDAKGLVTAGTSLAASDMPSNIDATKIATGSVTNTEFGYLDGVTGGIQGQLDAKVTANSTIAGATFAKITYDAKGLVTSGANLGPTDLPAGIDALKIGTGTVTNTEFGYLDGVTSAIQTQLSNKQPLSQSLSTLAAISSAGYLAYDGAGSVIGVTATTLRNALSPLTTKGDLYVYGTTNTRLPVGTNGQVLAADSAEASGLKWIPAASGTGSGEINLILNPNSSTNWTGTATVATDSTASNFPLQGALDSAIKISSSTSGQYQEYAFSVPSALARKLKIDLWYKHAGSATDWKVELYKGGVKQVLKTDVSGNSYLPAGTGRFQTDFDFEVASYTLRLVRAASVSMDLYVQGVVVGPGLNAQGAIVTEPTAFTPTGTWTNTTYTGFKSRTGTMAEYYVRLVLTGTPSAVNLRINQPSNETIDTSKIIDYRTPIGRIRIHRVGTAVVEGSIVFDSATQVAAVYWKDNAVAVAASTTNGISPTAPYTFASGDVAEITWRVPIAEWAGQGTVNIGAGAQVEYASSNEAWDATGTTTKYGPSGSAITGALTAGRFKTVTFTSPLQTDDLIQLEYRLAGSNVWISQEETLNPWVATAGFGFGGNIQAVTANSVTVLFAQYMGQGTVYNTQTGAINWSAATYDAWRVRRCKASSPVGFGLATATESGLVKGGSVPGINNAVAVASGYIGEVLEATQATLTSIGGVSLDYRDILSVTLTPGLWTLTGLMTFGANSGTNTTVQAGITASAGNVGTGLSTGVSLAEGPGPTANYNMSLVVPNRIVNISSSTTYYLKARSQWTGAAPTAACRLVAVRIG